MQSYNEKIKKKIILVPYIINRVWKDEWWVRRGGRAGIGQYTGRVERKKESGDR
jgi:hypothetical protein